MTRAWPCALFVTLAALAPACSSTGTNTQVMVTVDGEAGVRSMTRTLVVRVYGGPRGADATTLTLLQELPTAVTATSGWPDLVALAPLDRDATRIYRVEAAAYDVPAPTEATVPIATVRAISGYVPNRTVWLRLLLQDSCVGVPCIDVGRTCQDGTCVSASRPPETLPGWGDDAGSGSLDGGMDAARTDAGIDAGMDAATSDAGSDGGSDGGPLCVPSACDDGLSCTADSCGATGCVHVPRDVMCSDGNLCTDDRCDGTTADGCTHAPNAVACDDGTYCNGMDHCGASTCSVHDGNPCGGLICDEGVHACTGCNTTSDCPLPMTGSWSACSYAGLCSLQGTQSQNVRTFTCNTTSHQCTYVDSSHSQACGTRSTDGLTCAASTCDAPGSCIYGSTCDDMGLQPRQCHDFACAAGSCADSPRSSPLACARDTNGDPCDDGNGCTTPDTCSSGLCIGTPSCDSSLPDAGGAHDAGDAGSCDDGFDCTVDLGSPGTCINMPNHAYCNYGGACSTGTCNPSAPGSDIFGCLFTYACPDGGIMSRDGGSVAACSDGGVSCDDLDPCTIDSCSPGQPLADPLTGCVHLFMCSDGAPSTGDGGMG